MNIKYIKTSDLKPYERNAKKHPKDQIEKISKSIKEFGFLQPIVIDSEKIVVVGHGRLEAALKLKMLEVPCIEIKDLTEEQIKAYRLADNKLNESIWDMELVIEEIKLISEEMLKLTGISIPDFTGEGLENSNNEWVGMPEYNNEDKMAFRQIIVSFKNNDDVEQFSKKIGQKISNKTRSIWFPYNEIERMMDKVYE